MTEIIFAFNSPSSNERSYLELVGIDLETGPQLHVKGGESRRQEWVVTDCLRHAISTRNFGLFRRLGPESLKGLLDTGQPLDRARITAVHFCVFLHSR